LSDGHILTARWLTASKRSFADPRTVEVAGTVKNVRKEHLFMYFENKTRSGGGTVKDIQIFDDNTAYITFESSEGSVFGGQRFCFCLLIYINFNTSVGL